MNLSLLSNHFKCFPVKNPVQNICACDNVKDFHHDTNGHCYICGDMLVNKREDRSTFILYSIWITTCQVVRLFMKQAANSMWDIVC